MSPIEWILLGGWAVTQAVLVGLYWELTSRMKPPRPETDGFLGLGFFDLFSPSRYGDRPPTGLIRWFTCALVLSWGCLVGLGLSWFQ